LHTSEDLKAENRNGKLENGKAGGCSEGLRAHPLEDGAGDLKVAATHAMMERDLTHGPVGTGISLPNTGDGEFEMWGVTTITAPPSGGCAHDPAESRMLAHGRTEIQW
jgi:hypothetical protein